MSLVISAGSCSVLIVDRHGVNCHWRGHQFRSLARHPRGAVRHAVQLVPDTDIAWRDVLPGAVVTALLFNLGKFAIGWYIGTQGLESTYGAAASIVILLIWVYYSAQIVLFGAELTHAYATEIGSRRALDVNAELPHKAAV